MKGVLASSLEAQSASASAIPLLLEAHALIDKKMEVSDRQDDGGDQFPPDVLRIEQISQVLIEKTKQFLIGCTRF